MVVLLLYDGFDDLLGGNCRGDCPQPASVPFPNRLVKVQGDDLKDTGCNAAKVGKSLDRIGGLPDQILPARIFNFR